MIAQNDPIYLQHGSSTSYTQIEENSTMLPNFVGFLWFVYSVRHNCLLVNRPNFVLEKISTKH